MWAEIARKMSGESRGLPSSQLVHNIQIGL